jgi:hypothetical protein
MPVRDLLSAASGTGGATDPYFYDVSLLLNGDGTNGAQNNTFLDSSTNNFTITRNGNTTQGSFSPYGNLWSNYVTTSNYLTAPANAAFQMGSGDFTIEAWIFPTANAGSNGSEIISYGASGQFDGWHFQQTASTNTLSFGLNYAGIIVSSSASLSLNTWTYVAITRSGTTFKLWINGVNDGTATSSTSQSTNGSDLLYVGTGSYSQGSDRSFNGYISNARVVKGTAVYTTSFTPSTTPLTAISGTSLLTCQSNRFLDNSSNNFTITTSGSPSVQRFSPFNPTAPYSTSVIGGSGYFNGSSYLTITNGSNIQLGSSNFTLEGWIYPTTVSGACQFFTLNGSTGGYYACVLQVANGQLGTAVSTSGSGWAQTPAYGTLVANAWQHVAVSRSGTNFYYYINGVQVGTFSLSGALYNGTLNLLGAYTNGTFGYYAGYLCDSKFTIGSALYTGSTYTVPTAPVTTGTNTQFLENYANAGIPDLAMQNDLQTVGSAQVSTSVVKYGTGSLSFNGSGSYLVAPNNPVYAFGTGDFTMECWYYSGATGQQSVLDTRSSGNGPGVLMYTLSNKLRVYSNGGDVAGTISIPNNSWSHLVVERISGALYTYVNGVRDINGSSYTANLTDNSFVVGYDSKYGGFGLNGYLDDIRITKGLGRYTGSTFTPPTSALPTY